MYRLIVPLVVLGIVLTASQAWAIHFGAQLVYGDDSDIGIGARVEIETPELLERTRLVTDFNWYFPDDTPFADLTFWEINLNWLHRVGIDGGEGAPSYYLGGGLNFAYAGYEFEDGSDDSEKDLGVNLLGGLAFPLGALTGIGEVRITIAGAEQYNLGIGILY